MFHRHKEKQTLEKKKQEKQRIVQKGRFAYGALLDLAQTVFTSL